MKKEVTVLITDLDDTLYDWVDIWYHSFNAMLNKIAEKSSLDKEILKRDFKSIFQKYHTSEYSFAIEELPSLLQKHPGKKITNIYKDAIDAFRLARKEHLKLFPNVLETLQEIKRKGSLIVGYTESMEFYAKYRIDKLSLDGLFDYVYTPPEHDIPDGAIAKDRNSYVHLKYTMIKHTPKGDKKPNPKLLMQIINDINVPIGEVIYVGDKLDRDIFMAQSAKVTDVWAKYGRADKREEYELLRQVTHWTDKEVEREKKAKEKEVAPSYILNKGFMELLDVFVFKPYVIPRDYNKDNVDEVKICVDIWKKIIDVQQHFNDIEMRIRNLALMLLIAVIGAAGYIFEEGWTLKILNKEISYVPILLFAGLVSWMLFYFMDRHWYHRLLYGAVQQGMFVEERLRNCFPEMNLSQAIKKHSPLYIGNLKLNSPKKIGIFYGVVAVSLEIVVFIWLIYVFCF